MIAGVSILTFAIAHLVPGDPAATWAGPHASAAELAQARRFLGLNRPLPVQLARYFAGIATGNWGVSIHTHQPVLSNLSTAAPASLELVIAAEALSLGLVNHVVPDGELMARTEALAADLAAGPTFAFGMAKKLFHMASGPSYEDFLDLEAFVQPQLDQTEDHREGVAAFKEKRKPVYRGE